MRPPKPSKPSPASISSESKTDGNLTALELAERVSDPAVLKFFKFWAHACGTHRYPSQNDLDMMSIPNLLPNIFIIDILEDDFRYRFMGSDIDARLKVSLTGKMFREFRTGRALNELLTFFRRIADGDVLGVLETQLPSETEDWITYLRVGLPVADDHETPNKIVGYLTVRFDGGPFYEPPHVKDVETEEPGHVERHFGTLQNTLD